MSVPDEYLCPITRDIMTNPVILIEDGCSYEESALRSWLQKHNRSPMTNNVLSSSQYIPNRALKSLINDFNARRQSIASKKLPEDFLSFRICSEWVDPEWQQKPKIRITLSILGAIGVGKTVLAQCLRYGHWPSGMACPKTTIGNDLIFYYLDKLLRREYAVVIKLNDLPGQERFESVTNLFFRQCHGALLLTDMTNLESLQRLEQYWYPKVETLGMDHVQSVVVCTKMDAFEKETSAYRDSYLRGVQDFASRHQIPVMHVSAYRGDNVGDLFKQLIIRILDNDALLDTLLSQADASNTPKPSATRSNSIRLNSDEQTVKKRFRCCN